MKNKFFKRLFSLAIVVFMVVSMLPANVLAEGIATQSAAVDRDPDKNGCPHCEGAIEWITFDKATHLDANRTFIAGGHYKLGAALTLKAGNSYQPGTTTMDATVSTADMIIPEGMDVCFDLNGYAVTVSNIKTCTASSVGRYSRAFTNAGTLTILDSSEAQTGTIKGGAIGSRIGGSQAYGGNIYNTGTFNLYGGTISGGYAYARVYNSGALGGNVANGAGSTFNMYGGTITGGNVNSASFNYDTDEKKAHQGGGNLYSAGTVNIYGGTISSGTVGGSYSRSSSGSYSIYSKGGNVFMHTGTFNMYGGTVTGGKISRSFTFKTSDNKAKAGGYGSGGNIYTTNTDVSISNATITGGTIAISVKGESETTSSYAAAAYAYGGNIYIDGDDAKTKVTITDSVISGGVCNAAAAYADTTDTTNRGKGLYINNYGGNIYLTQVARTTIDGNTEISDGVCHGAPTTSDKTHAGGGGNICSNRILEIKGNTVISGGSGTESAGGSVYLGNYSSCTISENAKVINGVGNENSGGGNIYITGASAHLTVKDDAEVSGGSARGGGNIYANSSSHVTIAGGTVKNGIATWAGEEAYWGGGNILSFNSATVTITGGVISGGTANKFFNSVGMRSKGTVNILGGQIQGTDADNDLPLIGELTPDSGYGVFIYNGTIAEDPTAYLASCACYEMGANGEYKVWHVGANSEQVSCTKSNCAYTANTVEVDPDNTPDAADKHEYSEDGICTICGIKAIARVNFTDGTIKHYSSIIPALQAANGTGATVTALRDTSVDWHSYFETYKTRLHDVTLATENGALMYDTSLNSGEKVYMENVTFASGIDYKMTGYLYAYGTVNIYGTAFINMMTVFGTVNIYGNQGAQLTTNRNTWVDSGAINIYGGNDDELDWNANILSSGSYSLTLESTGKLYMENAKASFAGVDLDASGSATLEMVNSSLEVRNEGSSFTDAYSMTILGKGNVIMKGESALTLKGSVNIGENAKVTMSADSTFKTTTEELQNLKVVAAEDIDGCIYYAEGVYAVADHTYGEYTSNGDATCTTDGTKSATCSNCQAKDTVTDAGSKLEHTYGDWQQHNAAQHKKVCACGDTIYADHNNGDDRICDDCGFESVCTHQWGNAVVTKPTCTEGGYTIETCGLCGETRQIDETEATGHTLEAKNGTAADCLNPGHEAYWQCAECEVYFADEEGLVEIADIDAWKAEGGEGYIKALGHNLIHHDAKAPTCNEIGWDAYDTCSRCDYSTYVEQSATGNHTPGEPATENEVAANCGVAGSYDTVIYCTVCEKELSRVNNAIPASGNHNYELDEETEKFVCSVCKDEKAAVWCEACASYEMWTAWDGLSVVSGSHYYLADDLQLTTELMIGEGKTICLDLNGNTLTAADGKRIATVNGTLNIFDSGYNATLSEQTGEIVGKAGKIVGSPISGNLGGGVFLLNKTTAKLRIYAGILTGGNIQQGGIIQSKGTVYLYGGILYNGVATTKYGGNIYVDGGSFIIDGGIIYGGTSYDQGGNVYISNGGTVELISGKILNGISTARPGGNVGANTNATFKMYGGVISGGYGVTANTTTPTGCNIATTNAGAHVYIYGGTIGQTKDNLSGSLTAVRGTITIYNAIVAEDPTALLATCSDYCVEDGMYKVWHNAADEHSELIVNANADCHDWTDATCTAPKTCTKCEKIVGEAKGHTYTYTSNSDRKTHTIGCQDCDYNEVADCADTDSDKLCDLCAQKLIDPKFTVDGVEVETLDEALALAVNGSVIKLLDNVVLTERLTLDKELRIDLEGYSITGAFEDAFGMIYVKKGAVITFLDGLIENTADVAIGNYGFVIVATDATVNGVGAGLYNFYYQADYYGGSRVSGEVNAIWNSGELVISEDAVVEYLDNSGYATIYGTVNEIYAQDGSDAPGVYNGNKLIISDVAKVDTITVPEDYKLVEVEPYIYKVVACDYVVEVNGTKYENFQEAFAQVTGDATVVLLKDFHVDTTTEYITISGNVTLDLGGHYLSGNVMSDFGMFYVRKGAKLTVKNGTLANNATYAIGNYGEVVVEENATVIGEEAAIYNFYYQADYYGKTTMNGYANIIWNCGELVLNGVVESLDNSGAAVINGLAVEIIARDGSDCAAVTNAGTLTIADPSNVTLEEGFVLWQIAEGVYKVHAHSYTSVYTDPTNTEDGYTTYTCICGDSYVVVDEGTALHLAVNAETGASYEKLQDALDAAAKGETVKLLKDTEEARLFVCAGVKLDLNGKKMTVTKSMSASFTTTHIIDSSNGAGLLVLDGASYTFNGANEYLPVWVDGGVRFIKASFKRQLTTVDANTAKFAFYLNMDLEDTILDDILANGSAGTGITIRIKVTYTAANGMLAVQYFELSSDMVKQYVATWEDNAILLCVKGLEGRENVQFTAEILSSNPNDPSAPSVIIDKVDN